MPPFISRRRTVSVVLAIGLSLALAGQAGAATWSTPMPLTTSGDSWNAGLVTIGTTAVAIYSDDGGIYARRSTDSGGSWLPRVPLGTYTGPYHPSLAIGGRTPSVDVLWGPRASATGLRYARSTNSGASFGPSLSLSAGYAPYVDVARGPNGRVIVAWLDWDMGPATLRVRVSKNGGASFGAAKVLGTVNPYDVAVAAGTGAFYVAYYDIAGGLSVRRSTDSGATWGNARQLEASVQNQCQIAMTASGSQAYIAYSATSLNSTGTWLRVRRTTNKGVSWGSPVNLTPVNGLGVEGVELSLQGGVARLVYDRPEDPQHETSAVYYRQSANGSSWTKPKMVSLPVLTPVADAVGVGLAGRIMVLYVGKNPSSAQWTSDTYVRTGVP